MKETKSQLTITIGAMAPGLVKQFKQQGYAANWERLSHVQSDVDALVRLKVRGVIAEDIFSRAAKKLCDQAVKLATRV